MESTQVEELTLEAQDVREVLLAVMEDKGVGKASLKVERLCALLDPRRKALGADQLVNGSAVLSTRAEEDFKRGDCRASGCRHGAARADWAKCVGVLGEAGPARRGYLQPSGVWISGALTAYARRRARSRLRRK